MQLDEIDTWNLFGGLFENGSSLENLLREFITNTSTREK